MANAALGFIGFYAFWKWPGSMGRTLAGGCIRCVLPVAASASGAGNAACEPRHAFSALHLTAAVVFLTIAIPLKAEGGG